MDDIGTFGPALPPHLLKKTATNDDEQPITKVIGPALPPNFKTDLPEPSNEIVQNDESSSDEDIDHLGPMPLGHEKSSRGLLELEERALEIKLNGMTKADETTSNQTTREDWMIELPEIRKVADLGLTARQFRQREQPDFSDRSSWTKTPQSVAESSGSSSKVDIPDSKKIELEDVQSKKREKALEKIKKRHEKKHKRDKSLLELHQEKMKKKKKKDKKEKQERIPFSRETDLAVNRFDEAKKKAALKRSALLDTRFSSGSAKFL